MKKRYGEVRDRDDGEQKEMPIRNRMLVRLRGGGGELGN
jgi:hypothetical protein